MARLPAFLLTWRWPAFGLVMLAFVLTFVLAIGLAPTHLLRLARIAGLRPSLRGPPAPA
ncbi:MAG: hypothetical protein H7241_00220 [Novosphingobium sp.]|nr:hypothetical protein [Novosphingobium sp.]